MNIRNIIFSQFLEEDESIKKAFRKRFPFSRFVIWTALIAGAVLFVRWFFFCSLEAEYCPLGAESYYLFVAGGAFWLIKMASIWIHWYGNGVFMTSESLLFIYWDKLFEPRSVRLDYWDLDEIEVIRKGLSSYVGMYADLVFNKVSGGDAIVVTNVFRPHRTEQIISKNKEIMTDERNFTEESALKDLLAGLAVRHVESNGQPDRDKSTLKEQIESDYLEKKKANSSQNDFESHAVSNTKKSTDENLSDEQKQWIQDTKRSEDVKISPTHHFKNEIIEVEKKLDDHGGIEIDL